ncbi:hypothetical protein E3E35_01225 [Thermococcus sp. GR7]|uniref:hypothetical protein n=1 Tax=unclassified Thermococcus TaxID=2627626 RepID=UPI0014306021|nr:MULTISPECIES: hypothetical protein [unclassified Thermococcus]NJE46051.1 hypothetical protein [Thermococcus sp. GR7]NJE79363.1 hypothetical protein [Thermococcus sp. GR4]NJF22248.1 hypothetical protein [Thermococcus sp. GR5]
MVESIKVDIIENAYMPIDDEDPITLRLLFIQSEGNYYEIAVSKDMRVCYIRLARDIIMRRASERLQFSVHINCRESMVNITKEHTTTDRKKGVSWFTEEEWNFWGLTHQTCSWAYKLMNYLRVRLLLINGKDKQQAVEIAKKLEKYIGLLIKILESEEAEEVVYCKSKGKFLVSTHTTTFKWSFDNLSEEITEIFYDNLPELID